MPKIETPQAGQVWTLGGRQRLVAEIVDNAGEVCVGWQRPGNEWRTFYLPLKSWFKWVVKARRE